MIINEYKNQVQVLLRFLSDIDKGNCLPCETDQKLITQYIHHLSTNFNTQKAFSYMKRLLSEKMQAPEFKELFRGNDGKTYRKLRFDFENGDKFSSYPSRTTVIKICFDFNIRDTIMGYCIIIVEMMESRATMIILSISIVGYPKK